MNHVLTGIYLKSNFGQKIKDNTFNIPPPTPLPSTNTILPNVILGDEAFALHTNLMKPYPRDQSLKDNKKRVFNYRLSRARRTTENAFGILCAYFRVFFTPIAVQPDTIDSLITSACILHNILRASKIMAPAQVDFNELGDLKLPDQNLLPITAGHFGRTPDNASKIREEFKNYFNSKVGATSWQNDYM